MTEEEIKVVKNRARFSPVTSLVYALSFSILLSIFSRFTGFRGKHSPPVKLSWEAYFEELPHFFLTMSLGIFCTLYIVQLIFKRNISSLGEYSGELMVHKEELYSIVSSKIPKGKMTDYESADFYRWTEEHTDDV